MYLLDTNICVALMQGNPATIAKFDAKSTECYLHQVKLIVYEPVQEVIIEWKE